jgi:cell division transport system ATP-binding protein
MIRFDQVTKTYPGTTRPALNGVSLEVLKGEFVFLVGASGSGKSSFLRLVLKEDDPTRGRIDVLGQELGSLPARKVPYFRRSLGVVFQDFRLLPNKTVFDNVAFTLQVIGKSKGFIQEAVPDVLKMVGLAGKQQRFPHELSGGEQQRVAIARAIVNRPAILLADEPTGNLDPATSAGIMGLLATINANGTTVLMATHDAGIVDQMKRRVIELVGGLIVRDERSGGYQTGATTAPQPAARPVAPAVAPAPPAPEPRWDAAPPIPVIEQRVEPPSPAVLPPTLPGSVPAWITAPAPEPETVAPETAEPVPGNTPAPAPAAAPAPVTPSPAAPPDLTPPPPLNEPEPRR